MSTLKNVISNTQRGCAAASRVLKDYFSSQLTQITASDDLEGIEILYEGIANSDEFALLKEMALDGLSHLEMAQKRGIRVEACRQRMQRAKEILQKKIQD